VSITFLIIPVGTDMRHAVWRSRPCGPTYASASEGNREGSTRSATALTCSYAYGPKGPRPIKLAIVRERRGKTWLKNDRNLPEICP
jgi:hypothetical protein